MNILYLGFVHEDNFPVPSDNRNCATTPGSFIKDQKGRKSFKDMAATMGI